MLYNESLISANLQPGTVAKPEGWLCNSSICWHSTIYRSSCGHCFLLLQSQICNWGFGLRLESARTASVGWLHWAIEPLPEPRIHQSGKKLNPLKHSLLLLTISSLSLQHAFLLSSMTVCFHLPCTNFHQTYNQNIAPHLICCCLSVWWSGAALVVHYSLSSSFFPLCLCHLLWKVTHNQCHTPFYIFTPFFHELPMVCVWGWKSAVILSEIRQGSCVMKFTITPLGDLFPSSALSLWMGNY